MCLVIVWYGVLGGGGVEEEERGEFYASGQIALEVSTTRVSLARTYTDRDGDGKLEKPVTAERREEETDIILGHVVSVGVRGETALGRDHEPGRREDVRTFELPKSWTSEKEKGSRKRTS